MEDTTFIRKKNIYFYLCLSSAESIRAAAKQAGLTKQHATRLIKKWKDKGLIVRTPTLHGSHYKYSGKGEAYETILHDLYDGLRGEKEW
jgi:DNA-binding MarR family transcriptional regulator